MRNIAYIAFFYFILRYLFLRFLFYIFSYLVNAKYASSVYRVFYELISQVWKISTWKSGNIGDKHIARNTRARAYTQFNQTRSIFGRVQ